MSATSATRSSAVNRSNSSAIGADVGSIHGIDDKNEVAQIQREQLTAEEQVLSLPEPYAPPSQFVALTKFLGPSMTVANPAWGVDPIPHMRGLEKLLVDHSLSLEQADRGDCMAAVQVMEDAVKMRLRFQQMRMNEAELAISLESETNNEK